MGGDERTAVHLLVAAIADRPDALAHLVTLLVSLGRLEAAAVVAGVRAGR